MPSTPRPKDAGQLGAWTTDPVGLPAYRFDAPLPLRTLRADGQPARVPDDPWFLVGNDGLKLFAHASGRIQWLSGAREWARLNASDTPNAPTGTLSLRVGAAMHDLVGAAPARHAIERCFGVGFARWIYRTPEGVELEHLIDCPPLSEGGPQPNRWIEHLRVANRGSRPVRICSVRTLPLRYLPATLQRTAPARHPVRYRIVVLRPGRHGAMVGFEARPTSRFLTPLPADMASPQEWHPPQIRCEPLLGELKFRAIPGTGRESAMLRVSAALTLAPGEVRELAWCWTAFFGDAAPSLPRPSDCSRWRAAWAKAVPDFPSETNTALRREMRWHAAMLLSLAQWSQPYALRFLPQGTSYEFDWGFTCSARDHLQHALPLCGFAPWIAADSIRHACRKMTPTGEIRLMENGPASTTTLFFATSDQQLYFFGLLAEYLTTTRHASLLAEKHRPWPPQARSEPVTVLEHAERAFRFLRDEVGRGPHGLVRLLNSDWNDGIYWVAAGVPYPDMFMQAESHLNTAQACVVLGDAARALASAAKRLAAPLAGRARLLASQLDAYRAELLPPLLAEWKGRSFLPRAYTPVGRLGDEQMWLEPQAFALGIAEKPVSRRRRLLREMERRLAEPWGLRQQEKPVPVARFQAGGRENGGVWFALVGPAIVHAVRIDRKAAWRLLRKLTLAEHARQFPDFWPGIWTAPDNFESSLLPTAGLPDPQEIWPEFPAFCSHAHAWPLFAYLKLTGFK